MGFFTRAGGLGLNTTPPHVLPERFPDLPSLLHTTRRQAAGWSMLHTVSGSKPPPGRDGRHFDLSDSMPCYAIPAASIT